MGVYRGFWDAESENLTNFTKFGLITANSVICRRKNEIILVNSTIKDRGGVFFLRKCPLIG